MSSYVLCFIAIFTIGFSNVPYAETPTCSSTENKEMNQAPSYEVLGLAAACVDLLINVPDEFLKQVPGEKGGSQPIDCETLDRIVKDSNLQPQIIAGGSCANTIKALANLNTPCALLGTVGDDDLGRYFSKSMQDIGIISFLKLSSKPTARVLCLITPDGQRTMRFFPGSSRDMSESILDPNIVQRSKIVHIEGYALRQGELVKATMQMAKESKALVSIDLASFEVVKTYSDTIKNLLSNYTDIVFANRDEAHALTGLDPYHSCLKLQELCPIVVILTGEEGCLVGYQGKVIHSPAFPAKLIDTTGAGDYFAAGFLSGYLKGESLAKCAERGNFLGAAAIEVIGTELDSHKWSQIRQQFNATH